MSSICASAAVNCQLTVARISSRDACWVANSERRVSMESPTVEALTGQDIPSDLRHVEPIGVLGVRRT